jgi:hypothetical protein
MRLQILIIAITLTLGIFTTSVFAHILEDGRGPVDPFNFNEYDEETLAHLDKDCSEAFECQTTGFENEYFSNCKYDVQSSECQCSKGDISQCNTASSSLNEKEISSLKGEGFKIPFVGTAFGSVKGISGRFSTIPILAKIAALVIALVIFLAIFSRLKDNISNNLRKARSLHKKATNLHEDGDEKEAKVLFDKSNYHREKAYEGIDNKKRGKKK